MWTVVAIAIATAWWFGVDQYLKRRRIRKHCAQLGKYVHTLALELSEAKAALARVRRDGGCWTRGEGRDVYHLGGLPQRRRTRPGADDLDALCKVTSDPPDVPYVPGDDPDPAVEVDNVVCGSYAAYYAQSPEAPQ